MSADNWAICPKCHPGKHIDEAEHTLREDYEQGTDSNGDYYLVYTCRCEVCKFKWMFKHECNILKTPSKT